MATESISTQILSEGKFSGIFPGWGGSRVIALKCNEAGKLKVVADTAEKLKQEDNHIEHKEEHTHKVGLGVFLSTSIAGCDLMGSSLYTAGVCAFNSGKMAPFSLLLVTFMLFFFRRVYSEVVTAIPVNGGTYNVMLNTSTKKKAAFVACLSILSYTATIIVSAFDAVVYLSLIWTDCNIRLITIIILLVFGAVCICGVGESSRVSCTMFSLHMTVLTILIIWGFIYGIQDNFKLFRENFATPFPDVYNTSGTLLAKNSWIGGLFFGYCSALLGITGFETASNYVEEMTEPKVFVDTVNVMWALVGFYNPLLSFVSMMVLPMDVILEHPSDMLAEMAKVVGGHTFYVILCVNAVIVLCGGVITAIVGVSGLLKRCAVDKVLPEFLAYTNYRGGAYAAIIVFVILSISLFLAIFDPVDPTAIDQFGGVFAISFLTVLCAFGCSAVLLKLYRPHLARLEIAEWWQIGISLLFVSAGLIGNIVLTPEVFTLFLAYLSGFVAIVTYMFLKVEVFSFGIWMLRKMNLNKEKRVEAKKIEESVIAACSRQRAYDETAELLSCSDIELQAIARVAATPLKVKRRAASADEHDAPESPSRRNSGSHSHGLFFSTTSSGANTPTMKEQMEGGLIENITRRISGALLQLSGASHNNRSSNNETILELEGVMVNPIMGKMLTHFMNSLDTILTTPFVFLVKTGDPVSIHLAVEYMYANELSNNIYIVHFVDDRPTLHRENALRKHYQTELSNTDPEKSTVSSNEKNDPAAAMERFEKKRTGRLLKQFCSEEPHTQTSHEELYYSVDENGTGTLSETDFTLRPALHSLPPNAQKLARIVSIIDTFYIYKKVHCLIVRGAYFCPSAVNCVAKHLNIPKNNMIMGVPDEFFPFPFAQLNGVRLAVPVVDPALVQKTTKHFRDVLSDTFENDEPATTTSRSSRYATHGFSIYQKEDVKMTSIEELEALSGGVETPLNMTPPRKTKYSEHQLVATDDPDIVAAENLDDTASYHSGEEIHINI